MWSACRRSSASTARGVGPDGRVVGVFEPSRIRPKFMERLRIAGIFLPHELFEQTLEVN